MRVRAIQSRPKDHPFPLISWFIMFLQGMRPWKKGTYSHTAMIYQSETGMLKVAEVGWSGCKDRTLADFCKENIIVKTHEFEVEPHRVEFLRWFENVEGRPYDYLQLIGLLKKSFNLVTFNKVGNNFKHMICSELLLNFMQRFYGLEIEDPDNYDLLETWKLVEER